MVLNLILEYECYRRKYCKKSRVKTEYNIIYTLPNNKIKVNKTLSFFGKSKHNIIVLYFDKYGLPVCNKNKVVQVN